MELICNYCLHERLYINIIISKTKLFYVDMIQLYFIYKLTHLFITRYIYLSWNLYIETLIICSTYYWFIDIYFILRGHLISRAYNIVTIHIGFCESYAIHSLSVLQNQWPSNISGKMFVKCRFLGLVQNK